MKHNCCLFVMSISLFALCADANQIDSTTQQPSLAWVAAINMGPVWASGYLYLIRGINACGIANAAYAPI